MRARAGAAIGTLAGTLVLALWVGCGVDEDPPPPECTPRPRCERAPHTRVDALEPESAVADWGPPVRLGAPINTPCPEDAIETSRDGTALYFLFTRDLLADLPAEEIFACDNATYRAARTGGPTEFGEPAFFDLGIGIGASLDGEPSFAPDGRSVYFHSLRSTNTGYQQDPPADDFQDIYVADMEAGRPGPGRNLGPPVNSPYPDGEPAIHPDGVSLYFTSRRPGGQGADDIWVARRDGTAWTDPVNLGSPVNSTANDLQPAFTAGGDTLYFTSDRGGLGSCIYRSAREGDGWGEPELVINGIVGEPSLTADGRLLYFVHVLSDAAGLFDADVWVAPRRP